MWPADLWSNAIPTIEQLRNLLAAAVLVLGFAGLLYGVVLLSHASIDLGAEGWRGVRARWRITRNRRQVPRMLTDADRRQQLDAVVVHIPYHGGFGKGRRP